MSDHEQKHQVTQNSALSRDGLQQDNIEAQIGAHASRINDQRQQAQLLGQIGAHATRVNGQRDENELVPIGVTLTGATIESRIATDAKLINVQNQQEQLLSQIAAHADRINGHTNAGLFAGAFDTPSVNHAVATQIAEHSNRINNQQAVAFAPASNGVVEIPAPSGVQSISESQLLNAGLGSNPAFAEAAQLFVKSGVTHTDLKPPAAQQFQDTQAQNVSKGASWDR